MKIALISTAAIPTPPVKYGGIERSAYWLAEALQGMGHEVAVFAAPGSKLKTSAVITADSEAGFVPLVQEWNSRGMVDAIIDMSHDKAVTRSLPMVAQVNNWQGMALTYHRNPVFLSKGQAAFLGKSDSPVIYHGLDHEEYPTRMTQKPGGYLLYLGAVIGVKQPHLVAEAAVRLGRRAIIAGPAWDTNYWPTVKKMREMPGVEVAEEVGGKEKIELMHGAACLVHPIGGNGWVEAGAVVALEAIMMGLPVVATPNGCLPEYVTDGETGYLCADSVEAICVAVEKAEKLKPPDVIAGYDYNMTNVNAAIQYTRLCKRAKSGGTW